MKATVPMSVADQLAALDAAINAIAMGQACPEVSGLPAAQQARLTSAGILADWLKARRAALASAPASIPVVPPDCLSLPWWRMALKIWMRTDAASGAQVARYTDVDNAIKVLETAASADGSPDLARQRAGMLAREQFEYANSATRAQLQEIAPAFGFSLADCDESLWRADRVSKGDLTGVWPLAAAST